jgi:hypothetical protein
MCNCRTKCDLIAIIYNKRRKCRFVACIELIAAISSNLFDRLLMLIDIDIQLIDINIALAVEFRKVK